MIGQLINKELIDDLSYMNPSDRHYALHKCALCGNKAFNNGYCVERRDKEGHAYRYYFCGKCSDSIEFIKRLEQNVEEYK